MNIEQEFYLRIINSGEKLWFKSIEERRRYMYELASKNTIHVEIADGYSTREEAYFHRVIQYRGERHYSCKSLGNGALPGIYSKLNGFKVNFDLGMNDFPLGEHFDYKTPEIKIVEEWITGAQSISPFRDPDYVSKNTTFMQDINNI